jgi:cytoskeletal protein RodZ
MRGTGSVGIAAPARPLVLGAALAIGLTLALLPHPESALAARDASSVVAQANPTPKSESTEPRSGGAATGNSAGASQTPGVPTPPNASRAAPDTTDEDTNDDEDAPKGQRKRVTVDKHGIVIEKGNKRVRVEALGMDHEYDSFEQFVQDAPWLAGLVFFTVLLVFLVPLLIIVLLIWYKIRKNRMANETMLKLAERGVVSPTAAMDAVASGNAARVAEAASATPPGVPAYEHANALRQRAVWSDLRKGVILTGVGLGLSFFSMLDDGTPNSVGLVFLFIGLGYCVLWFLEDRTRPSRSGEPSTTPPNRGA